MANQARPAGYAALAARYSVTALPNWHESFVATGNTRLVESFDGRERVTYPSSYWQGESIGDHLEFALKYDGINLAILAQIFRQIPKDELVAYVRSKPGGKYARRIWFLYERLTEDRLPLDDLTRGNYIDLLDTDRYYVSSGRPVRRQRLRDNLLGEVRFCPLVRRTDRLAAFEQLRQSIEGCTETESK